MMPIEKNVTAQRQNIQDEISIYCMLFADDVPMSICALRMRELHGRGEFTCSGCIMATV